MKNLFRLYLSVAIMTFLFCFCSYADSVLDDHATKNLKDEYEIETALTDYIATPSNAVQYLEKYKEVLDGVTLDGEIIKDEEEGIAYIASLAPEPILDSIAASFYVHRFVKPVDGYRDNPSGIPGYIFFRITINNSEDRSDFASRSTRLQISPRPYEYNPNDFLARDYAEKYKKVIDVLDTNGVKMSDANLPEEMEKYISTLAPDGKNANISLGIKVFTREDGKPGPGEFRAAVAGTKDSRKGKRGSFSLEITVTNKLCDLDIEKIRDVYISILPTPYVDSSSSGGSSSGGGSQGVRSGGRLPVGMTVTKPSVYEGNWKQENEKWKLVLLDGTQASSQWANINGRWYLLGVDGYMMTDWNMVNNKWYYLEKDGSMAVGWIQLNGKWYYLDASGAMLHDTTTPDGYRVNSDGAWIS